MQSPFPTLFKTAAAAASILIMNACAPAPEDNAGQPESKPVMAIPMPLPKRFGEHQGR